MKTFPYNLDRRPRRSGLLPLCLVATLALASLAAAQTPPPRHIALEKYKRGYTVYTPAGLEDNKTYPALIWLHPLDSNMNTRIRQDWWDDLNRRKIFLVLPESADPKAWDDPDVSYIMDLTADLTRRFPVDRKKLVLFGYQAGGQMAFDLARTHAGRFASVITMSAYPVRDARDPVLSLPPDSARRSLSLLMIVGTADVGRMFCRQAAEQLDAKGFAVGLLELPDLAQVYTPAVKPQVLSWLDQISAGARPSLPLPDSERLARQDLADSARKIFADILAPPQPVYIDPAAAHPPGATLLNLPKAGLSLRLPYDWKLLADEPGSARLTTIAPPPGPLLVQLSLGKSPRGLARAVKDHEARNRTRGIRYSTLETTTLKLDDRTWTLQQATCLSYHRRTGPDGKPVFVDAPSIVTVAYFAPDPKSPDYIRVVFLYTKSATPIVGLIREVLSSVRILPRAPDDAKVIE